MIKQCTTLHCTMHRYKVQVVFLYFDALKSYCLSHHFITGYISVCLTVRGNLAHVTQLLIDLLHELNNAFSLNLTVKQI